MSKLRSKALCVMGILSGAVLSQAAVAQVSVAPELQKKIATHPHTRQLTDWGSRPEWSPDSKRLIFVSKEFGDAYEFDIATGKTLPLTYGYPHVGIFRAYYLKDGNFLFTAPREHIVGIEPYTRIVESELWLLDKHLTSPAVPLDLKNGEGVAVARGSMRIAWMAAHNPPPPKPQPKFPGARPTISTLEVFDALQKIHDPEAGIYIGDIVGAKVVNRRRVVSCEPDSPLTKTLVQLGQQCAGMEPQNFVPTDENRLTFSALAKDAKRPIIVHTFVVDTRTGALTKINPGDAHAEVEGVFADGRHTLVEHSYEKDSWKAGLTVDLWQMPLDGSGRMQQVTQYNRIDPELKSNQGVISPDGRWMAYTVATQSMERVVPGQGVGIFLMDLKAAGF